MSESRLAYSLFGFAAFQHLHAACELGVIESIRNGETTPEAISKDVGLSEESTRIVLMGCVALGLLVRGADGSYGLSDEVEQLFVTGDWKNFRDIVSFQQEISYRPASYFARSLREGWNAGVNELPGDEPDMYSRLAHDPEVERTFYRGMSAWSRLSNPVLMSALDELSPRRVLDVGGGDGANAIAAARRCPGSTFTVLERETATMVAQQRIDEAGLSERIDVVALDFLTEPWPTGYDCVLFAHQMVIWSEAEIVELLVRARDCLNPGGSTLIFNAMVDDTGDGPLYSALDSVYFTTLPNRQSKLYRWRDFEACGEAAGYRTARRVVGPGWTPHGVVVLTR